jgi:protein-disulfide isomerase
MESKKASGQRRRDSLSLVGVAILTSIIAFGCASSPGPVKWAEVPGVQLPAPQVYPMQRDNAIGDPRAPVRIDEYGDFQCPYCRQFALQAEPQIIDQYVASGKVYFVYHSMGNFLSDKSKTPDTESKDAAIAAYAAGEQNRFWQYHDLLYTNQSMVNAGYLTRLQLDSFARALSLDMKKFNAALDSPKLAKRVEEDRMQGEMLGVTGIPTLFINGEELVGAQSFADYQKVIDAKLAAAR